MKTTDVDREGTPEPWPERKRQAEAVINRLRESPRDEEARRSAVLAAKDPKWEVRKVIAEAMASLSDDLNRDLEPLLRDPNVLVQTAARRSLERRSPASGIASSSPGILQGTLDKIETRHGPEARAAALKLAEKFVELHLRSAVHDVRNVLTHFNLDVKEIINALPDDASKARVQRYEKGKNYLENLVAMMDQYSEDLSLKCTPEPILEVLNEGMTSAVEQIESQGRKTDAVECVVTASANLIVPVSRFHLSMVVTNLAKNGIESHAESADKMRPGKVMISACEEGDLLILRVEDTGKGIAPGDLAKLREFIPGGSSKRRSGHRSGMGTGYGLPICRRYVDAHGGTLAIESVEGQGTRVTVRIPVASHDEFQK